MEPSKNGVKTMSTENGNGSSSSPSWMSNWKQLGAIITALVGTGLVSWTGVQRELDAAKDRIQRVENKLDHLDKQGDKIERKLDRLIDRGAKP